MAEGAQVGSPECALASEFTEGLARHVFAPWFRRLQVCEAYLLLILRQASKSLRVCSSVAGYSPRMDRPLKHFLGHEILERGHFQRFIRDIVGEMRGNNGDAFSVADDHIAGKNGRVAAADRPVDLDRLMQGEVRRCSRSVVICGEGSFLELRGSCESRHPSHSATAADHEAGYEDGACGSGARVLAAVDDEHGPWRALFDRLPLRMIAITGRPSSLLRSSRAGM